MSARGGGRAQRKRGGAVGLPSRDSIQALMEVARSFAGRRVVLVGDMLADHYLYGKTSRISREAPVLILKYQEKWTVPGQAANTASNIASLGGRVTPIGVIGKDPAGRDLKAALKARGVRTDSLVELKSYSTLTKTRILAGGHHTSRQQVIRIDDDDRPELDGAIHRDLADRIRKEGAEADALVVSDYGYGLVSEEVWQAALEVKARRGIPLILDSRYQFLKLKGATIITPNEEEAVGCCGLSTEDEYDIEAVGRKLLKQTGAENVLVTRGNEGMVLFRPGRPARHVPIFGSDECTDVTGAGDTVVATVALALAAGATPEQAVLLANTAGGIVVMKMGTATVSTEELLASLILMA